MSSILNELRETLIAGLDGEHTHRSPHEVLNGLTAEAATHRFKVSIHNCWEELHHMVVWQDIVIDQIERKASENELDSTAQWTPKGDSDRDWRGLCKKFFQGIERIKQITRKKDLFQRIEEWPETNFLHAILIVAQHNSYHLGQIVILRQLLEDWNPPHSS